MGILNRPSRLGASIGFIPGVWNPLIKEILSNLHDSFVWNGHRCSFCDQLALSEPRDLIDAGALPTLFEERTGCGTGLWHWRQFGLGGRLVIKRGGCEDGRSQTGLVPGLLLGSPWS